MTRNRSLKTVLRDNAIHEAYKSLMSSGGEFATAVSRKFIYAKLSQRTGYSVRLIAEVLNHTEYTNTAFF